MYDSLPKIVTENFVLAAIIFVFIYEISMLVGENHPNSIYNLTFKALLPISTFGLTKKLY